LGQPDRRAREGAPWLTLPDLVARLTAIQATLDYNRREIDWISRVLEKKSDALSDAVHSDERSAALVDIERRYAVLRAALATLEQQLRQRQLDEQADGNQYAMCDWCAKPDRRAAQG
jgi:hypothetical protein